MVPPRPSQKGGRSVSYSVLRIADHTGVVRYEVVETLRVKAREKEIQDAYLKAARDWKPSEEPNAGQPPTKPEVRVWRTVMGGPDARERAEAIAEECRRREKEGKLPDTKSTTPDPTKDPTGSSGDPLPSLKKIPGPLVK